MRFVSLITFAVLALAVGTLFLLDAQDAEAFARRSRTTVRTVNRVQVQRVNVVQQVQRVNVVQEVRRVNVQVQAVQQVQQVHHVQAVQQVHHVPQFAVQQVHHAVAVTPVVQTVVQQHCAPAVVQQSFHTPVVQTFAVAAAPVVQSFAVADAHGVCSSGVCGVGVGSVIRSRTIIR